MAGGKVMPFDWATATDLEEVQAPTPAGAPGTPQEKTESTLETKIPFDWASAQDAPDDGGQGAMDVEGGAETVFIHAPEAPEKQNFLDALAKTAKDYALKGSVSLGEEISEPAGEALGLQENALKRQNARSQAIYSLSQATGLPLHEVGQHFDDLVQDPKLTGIKGSFATPLDVLELGLAFATPFAFLTAPVATVKGLLIFGALDKLIPTEKFIESLGPETSRDTKEALRLVDMIAKGALTAGVYKKTSPLINEAIERFTLDKLQKFRLPTTVKLTPEQVRDIWQTGKLTTGEQKSLLAELNLTSAERKRAIDMGITINVPAQKLSKVMDKPYWKKIKDIFGAKPVNKTTVSSAGKASKAAAGLLDAPKMAEIVTEGGGVFVGYQAPSLTKSGKNFGNMVYFNSPKTDSTLVLKMEQLTPEAVKAKIADSDEKFAKAQAAEKAKAEEAKKPKEYEYKPMDVSESTKGKTFYHGTKADMKSLADADVYGKSSVQNLYGEGLYLTDSPAVAESYAKNKGKGKPGSVLSAKLQDLKLIDLEKPLPDDVWSVFVRQLETYSDNAIDFKGKPGKAVFDELKEGMQDAGIYDSEAIDIYGSISDGLSQLGYDGFRYEGGNRVKGAVTGKHNALVLFEQDAMQGGKQVGRLLKNKIEPGEIRSVKSEQEAPKAEQKQAPAEPKAVPRETPPPAPPKLPSGGGLLPTGDEGVSRAFERAKEKWSDELADQPLETYTKISIADQMARAFEFLKAEPELSRRVAFGMEPAPAGLRETAVAIAYAEAQKEAGNLKEFSDAYRSRSLRQTARGQEIVLEKAAATNVHDPAVFIEQVLQKRMENQGKKLWELSAKKEGSASGRKAFEKIKSEAKNIKRTVVSSREMDIAEAQAIIDSLIC